MRIIMYIGLPLCSNQTPARQNDFDSEIADGLLAFLILLANEIRRHRESPLITVALSRPVLLQRPNDKITATELANGVSTVVVRHRYIGGCYR